MADRSDTTDMPPSLSDTHERYWFQCEPIASLIANQEPLGREFEKVLIDNLWSLYVRS